MNIKFIRTLALLGLINLNIATFAQDKIESFDYEQYIDHAKHGWLFLSKNYESLFGLACLTNSAKRFNDASKPDYTRFGSTKDLTLAVVSLIAAASIILDKGFNSKLLCNVLGSAGVYAAQGIAASDILFQTTCSSPATNNVCSKCQNVCKCKPKEQFIHKLETVARCAIALPALYIIFNKLSQQL